MGLSKLTLAGLSLLSVLPSISLALVPSQNTVTPRESSFEQDPATYDDACNIGYCSVMGATLGGWGAESYTYVSTQAEFASAVAGSEAGVIIVQGSISGSGTVAIGSGKSIIGAPGSSLHGISLLLSGSRSIILRNFKIGPAETEKEAGTVTVTVTIENSRNIWVDHFEFSAGAKLNITRGSDYVSVTNNLFTNHTDVVPAISVGHSDTNSAQDGGKFHVTFGRNYFRNVRNAVSFRFGTGHFFNSYFENFESGINTRMGAQILVEASVFASIGSTAGARAVFSSDSLETGSATLRDVVLLGESITNTAPAGEMTADSVVYPYDWYIYDRESVLAAVTKYAGQTLEFLTWD